MRLAPEVAKHHPLDHTGHLNGVPHQKDDQPHQRSVSDYCGCGLQSLLHLLCMQTNEWVVLYSLRAGKVSPGSSSR